MLVLHSLLLMLVLDWWRAATPQSLGATIRAERSSFSWQRTFATQAHINYTVAQLEKQKAELDEKIAELNSKKKNPMTELGFAKSIGNSEAKKLKSALPDAAQQTRIMAFFADKCAYGY